MAAAEVSASQAETQLSDSDIKVNISGSLPVREDGEDTHPQPPRAQSDGALSRFGGPKRKRQEVLPPPAALTCSMFASAVLANEKLFCLHCKRMLPAALGKLDLESAIWTCNRCEALYNGGKADDEKGAEDEEEITVQKTPPATQDLLDEGEQILYNLKKEVAVEEKRMRLRRASSMPEKKSRRSPLEFDIKFPIHPQDIRIEEVNDISHKPWKDRLPVCIGCVEKHKEQPRTAVCIADCGHAIGCLECCGSGEALLDGLKCPIEDCYAYVNRVVVVRNTRS